MTRYSTCKCHLVREDFKKEIYCCCCCCKQISHATIFLKYWYIFFLLHRFTKITDLFIHLFFILFNVNPICFKIQSSVQAQSKMHRYQAFIGYKVYHIICYSFIHEDMNNLLILYFFLFFCVVSTQDLNYAPHTNKKKLALAGHWEHKWKWIILRIVMSL